MVAPFSGSTVHSPDDTLSLSVLILVRLRSSDWLLEVDELLLSVLCNSEISLITSVRLLASLGVSMDGAVLLKSMDSLVVTPLSLLFKVNAVAS